MLRCSIESAEVHDALAQPYIYIPTSYPTAEVMLVELRR